MMKKRWISLYVENEVGVLAKISGLFSGKSYNLQSLTVGTTEDKTISRVTIGLESDEPTFEQIKKQLNRSLDVIKVIDLTNMAIHNKELMFIKVTGCNQKDKTQLFQIAETFSVRVKDYGPDSLLLEAIQPEQRNDDLINLLKGSFGHIEVVRGGSVAIEAISKSNR